jgi:4-hydroxymandelate oxidase
MAVHLPALLQAHAEAARAQLAPEVWDYYDAGSGEEVTREESVRAWASYRWLPRTLRDVSTVDLATELLGETLPSPLVVAPMALQGLAHPEAEVATARGTASGGHLMTLSTRASALFEDVAAVPGTRWWFQVYVTRDRQVTEQLVQRAAAAGATALVLTGDTPYVGRKARVGGVRIALPPDQHRVNLGRHLSAGGDPVVGLEQDPSITEALIGSLRAASGLPVLVKGVLRPDDARRFLDAGAAGVVVSNHGGRQLDRSVPSAHALAAVVDAVGGRGPVVADSGLRTGLDVMTALALGADAAMVGRPVLWALAAGGGDGVASLLAALDDDLRHVMALAGASSPQELTRDLVTGPSV